MTVSPIAASDLDVIIGIVAVVGWILAQIFGKSKREAPRQDDTIPEGAPSLDSREELRKFFTQKDDSAGTTRPTNAQKRPRERVITDEPLRHQKAAREIPRPRHPSPMPAYQNPLALRQFIIASEILGKPIALR